MFEISLVPDVKSELIKKLKLRNLIILICIIVAVSCAGVVLILASITAGQSISLHSQSVEMACRSEGAGGKIDKKTVAKAEDCKNYDIAIKKFENEEELLTIQNQMKNLSIINGNKIEFSRVFMILNTVLPRREDGDDNEVQISEVSADINNSTLFFDAVGSSSNNIGYRALEAFKKNTQKTYFDYGNYMREDKETGEYVAIPSFCIDEVTINKIIYGVYHKGNPGCEAPMIEKTAKTEEEKVEDEKVEAEENSVDAEENESETEEEETKTEEVEKKDIYIRRTYNNMDDLEKYKNGNDDYPYAKDAEAVKGYYFESKCLQYKDGYYYDAKKKKKVKTQVVDEEATLETCPLLSTDIFVGDSAYGKDSDGNMALSFSSTLTLTPSIFYARNKHVLIVSPTRQNVTDSYVQIKDMFTAPIETEGEVEENGEQ